MRRHLRDLRALRRFRGRHAVVVVCRDDATGWERHRDAFTALEAELVLEPHAGALSAAIGRPAVGVCDRYLDLIACSPGIQPDAALAELRYLACRCEECPQAIDEPGGDAWAAG